MVQKVTMKSLMKCPKGVSEGDYEWNKQMAILNKQLIKWARKYDIPMVATTDAHYLDEEDEYTQEVLFAVKDNKR